MAHSYIEVFGTEEEAFRAFARAHPGPVTFLVDTYDTENGVATAARVLKDLGLGPGCAIRLDSGDLGALAVRSRRILDAARLHEVRIAASGGLDESAVDRLVRSGAPIDTYAVGTKTGVSADAPYLDSAYKLVEYDGRPVMKLSSAKVTAPGRKQVFRRPGYADAIGLHDEPSSPDGEPLLETVVRHGARDRTDTRHSRLDEARGRFAADLTALPADARRITSPVAPKAVRSQPLTELAARVRHRVEREILADTR